MAREAVADPDIWWHLRNAETLIRFHQFPRYDTYSFTVAGHPWINTEWLSEIPFYLAWRAWGLMGVEVLVLLLVDVIFLGLLYLSYRESGNFKAAALACCFSIFLGAVSFGPRTILFGYVYLVALLIILQRLRREGHAPLWLIPPLFLLWANSHGSWILGLIFFAIVALAGFVEGSWGCVDATAWTTPQRRKLLLTALGSAIAVFVNPFGTRLALYPFDLAFRQKLNIAHIAEWVSVDFHDFRGKMVLALLMILLVNGWMRRGRWALAEVGLVLFALYCGLTYIRFLFLLGIVAAPVIAKMLDFVPPYQPEIDKPLLNALLMAAMVGGIIFFWPSTSDLQGSIDREYPAETLQFLKAHPLQGRMLNFYLWGGYLGWNDRDLKVFVDSRVDIFEYAGVLKDYIDLLALREPSAILQRYDIRYVLFPRGEALTFALLHDPGWEVLHDDRVGILFERTDATGAPGPIKGLHGSP